MKNSLVKLIFGIVLFLSFQLNAELIFEDDFPKDIQGIWSENCNTEELRRLIENLDFLKSLMLN